jgi:Ca2+:H+ antiporter
MVLLKMVERLEHEGKHVPAFLAMIASRGLIFFLCLLSIIPLSYFIGMAVASISAQSSIGMGAVINATFGSIIEILLYSIALTQSKGRLVEGSIVGSLLAGVLLMPGMSMCSGALRRKELKFNAKSASVTSMMLIMAIIGALTPTLFYQTYGNVCLPSFVLFLIKFIDRVSSSNLSAPVVPRRPKDQGMFLGSVTTVIMNTRILQTIRSTNRR